MNTHLGMNQPAAYRIQVQGRLPEHWPDFFGHLQVEVESDSGETITTLAGTVIDQAALHGILQALYALGLPVLSVQCDLSSKSNKEVNHHEH
jgi:hypothetical protein